MITEGCLGIDPPIYPLHFPDKLFSETVIAGYNVVFM